MFGLVELQEKIRRREGGLKELRERFNCRREEEEIAKRNERVEAMGRRWVT